MGLNKKQGQVTVVKTPRRLWGAALVLISLWLLVVGRLVQVQAVQHESYGKQAQIQHQRLTTKKAKRGNIFDRHGIELALDVQAVSFYADPYEIKGAVAIARHFSRHGGTDVKTLERRLQSKRRFVYLARGLRDTELSEARSVDFIGVYEHPESQRYFPYGPVGSQLLGFVDIDNKGSEGAERAFDAVLQGTDGHLLTYVDSRGHRVPGRELEYTPPQHGKDLVLTIDAVYQDILEEELARAVELSGAERALGIIADPRTGEILAMGNVPLYNPNIAGEAKPAQRRNRAVTDPFEPGSTFKVVTAAAVLEEGLAQVDEEVFCENGRILLANGDIINDVHPYGTLSFGEVIEKSSNIGVIKMARRLERGKFYQYIRSFGFGIRSGVELPAESAGVLRQASDWSERSLETLAIGQEISVTALQMVQALGVIANEGVLMAPQIVREIRDSQGHTFERRQPKPVRRVISVATANKVKEILSRVVERGTGKRATIDGMRVAGKTGTAQRVARQGKGYAKGQYVVSFMGFLPVDAPRLLGVIVVDNPRKQKYGGEVAAPAFKKIMERILHAESRLFAGSVRADPSLLTTGTVPDLRGLRASVARFQGEVRGIKVEFSGRGDVVVDQRPQVGSLSAKPGKIVCELGYLSSVQTLGQHGIPLRQALFLDQLGDLRGREQMDLNR